MINLFSNYLALKAKNITLGKIESKIFNAIGFALKTILGLYIIFSIIYRTILVYSPSFFEAWPFTIIFSPLFWVETQFGRMWAGLLSADFYNIGTFKAFYLPLLILLFVGIQSLWVLINSKKWLSLRSLILVYIVSLFFITSTNFVNKPDFKLETINLSTVMEKNKVGLLYPLLKYLNYESGAHFRYAVTSENNKFFILNNSGEIFSVNVNEPFNNSEKLAGQIKVNKEQGSEEMSKKLHSKMDIMVSMLNWPKDFECVEKDFITQNYCPEVWYQGKLIFKSSEIDTTDLALSENKKWLLLVTSKNSWGPEEVYLIKLK